MNAATPTPIEVLYSTPAPFSYDLAHDLASAIEGAIPQAKVTRVDQANGVAYLQVRPDAGYLQSTESALRHFAQMPGPVVVDVLRVSDHLWIRAQMR